MTAAGATTPRVLAALAVPAMLGVGAVLAVQAQITGRLAAALGGGPPGGALAALWSFGSGLVIVSVVVLLSPARRAGVRVLASSVRGRALPRWYFLGGALGAFLVASQALAVPVVGVALFTVALVAGQTVSALAVDHAGLGPAGRQRVTMARVVATVLTIAAVLVTVAGRLQGAGALAAAALVVVLLPLAAGMAGSFQQAFNGRVAGLTGSWVATWNNFVAGTAVLAVFAAATRVGAAPVPALPSLATHGWLYLSGVLGVLFVWANAVLVRAHGVLVLAVCIVAGQVVTATALDLAGGGPGGPGTAVGAALTIAGVLLAVTAQRRASGPGSRVARADETGG
ncbi:MAG: DMT family transporter [Cellulomonadaceae bacterium]